MMSLHSGANAPVSMARRKLGSPHRGYISIPHWVRQRSSLQSLRGDVTFEGSVLVPDRFSEAFHLSSGYQGPVRHFNAGWFPYSVAIPPRRHQFPKGYHHRCWDDHELHVPLYIAGDKVTRGSVQLSLLYYNHQDWHLDLHFHGVTLTFCCYKDNHDGAVTLVDVEKPIDSGEPVVARLIGRNGLYDCFRLFDNYADDWLVSGLSLVLCAGRNRIEVQISTDLDDWMSGRVFK